MPKKKKKAAEERVELLDANGDCTPAFKRVLLELFQRFDSDGDRFLNEEELRIFSRTANEDGREFDQDEFDQIKEHFDWKDGKGLTLRGWQQMFHTQTGGEEEETWKDLKHLGYDGQLNRVQKAKQTKISALQTQLEVFLNLVTAGDVTALVAAFAPADFSPEEQAEFVSGLQQDNGRKLSQLQAEIRCCASGEGVIEVEEENPSAEDARVIFNFHSPSLADSPSDRPDRSAVFALQEGQWRAEDGWRLDLL
eukprot:TRINITY_DN10956_c0_g1_i2.p1 TRINITY_DN10956_c0_g1~~TRINITY_DN10956_c0_g1_i2.p1  ORF type:complete len:260 (+),score=80.50 TRINITY_DN10956_c0_g1_i2:25-780(+)